jgi:Cu(I)-responsive transcriptional regulator
MKRARAVRRAEAKGPKPLTIGELAKATGTNVETVRYYERIGVLSRPQRTPGGFRLYGPEDVSRLAFVRRARELGFSLEAVRELIGLADHPDRPCGDVDEIARAHLADVEQKIAHLAALRTELNRLLAQCRGGHISDCRIVDALSGGPSARWERSKRSERRSAAHG